MKKKISMVLVILLLMASMPLSAFAADDLPKAVVKPLSEAPAMEHTRNIGPVTFSNVVSVEEKAWEDYYGEPIHLYYVTLGVGTSSHATMKCDDDDVEFYYYDTWGFNLEKYGRTDTEYTTGEVGIFSTGYFATADLTFFSVLPYANERDRNGNWNGGLVWEFLMDREHTNMGVYRRMHDVKAVVNGEPYYYKILLTNRPDYKNGTVLPGIQEVRIENGVAFKPAERAVAYPTASKVYIDGKETEFEAYTIGGRTYFKLRDVALALRGTDKQFNVVWDRSVKTIINEKLYYGAIFLTSYEPYVTAGGEMVKGDGTTKQAKLTTTPLYLDNKTISLPAYNIGGHNFFMLRDLGNAFDFNVSWDRDLRAIIVETGESYDATT